MAKIAPAVQYRLPDKRNEEVIASRDCEAPCTSALMLNANHVSDSCQITSTNRDSRRPPSPPRPAPFLDADGPRPTETTAGQNCHAGGRGFESVAPVPCRAV